MRKLLFMTRSIVAALTFAILFGGSAIAQNAAPALKASVTVNSVTASLDEDDRSK